MLLVEEYHFVKWFDLSFGCQISNQAFLIRVKSKWIILVNFVKKIRKHKRGDELYLDWMLSLSTPEHKLLLRAGFDHLFTCICF